MAIRCGTVILSELNPKDKHIMMRPMMMQGLFHMGYHASMPKTSGEEKYINPMAHVPMLAMLCWPSNGGCGE